MRFRKRIRYLPHSETTHMDNDAKLIDSAEIEELQDRIEALESDQAMDAGVLDG